MPLPQELIEAFRQAIYLVNAEEPIAVRIDHPSDQLQQLLIKNNAQTAAIITADNPRSQLLPDDVNRLAEAQLRSLLQKDGFRFLKTIHRDIGSKWPDEHGFLVFDIPRERLDHLLVEFGQLAAVTIDSAGNPSLLFSLVDSAA